MSRVPSNRLHHDGRNGIVLLVVIAMLTLFASVALTFVFYADAQSTAAQISQSGLTGGPPDVNSQTLMSFFMGQFIYGTDNPYSAMRGYDLMRSLYGYNPADGTNSTPFSGVGRLRYTENLQSPINPKFPLTYPTPYALPNTAIQIDNYNFVNYQKFDQDNFERTPEFFGAIRHNTKTNQFFPDPNYRFIGGHNVPWTAPDLNNMYLGLVSSDGEVIMPSFYRGWTGVQWGTSQTGPNPKRFVTADNVYRTVFPHQYYHDKFYDMQTDPNAGCKNLDFSLGWLNSPIFDPTTNARPQAGNDSFWMDLGFPVITASNGTKFKPLFAPLILDLDNRVHLWLAGNQLNANKYHLSNQGFGPPEVNLSRTFMRPSDALNPNPNEITTLFQQRYNSKLVPPQLAPNGVVTAGTGGQFYSKTDYDANGQPTGVLTLPPAGNFTVYPTYGVGWQNAIAAELRGSHLGYNVSSPTTAGDNPPWPVLHMDALLRYGTTAPTVTSNLFEYIPNSLKNMLMGQPPLMPQITLLSAHFDRPLAQPYISVTPSSANVVYGLDDSVGYPWYAAVSSVMQNSPNYGNTAFPATLPTGPGEFLFNDGRSSLAQRLKGNLNPIKSSVVIAAVAAVGNPPASRTVTVTTKTPHSFATGNTITIGGLTPPTYDGSFIVNVIDNFNFTYTAPPNALPPSLPAAAVPPVVASATALALPPYPAYGTSVAIKGWSEAGKLVTVTTAMAHTFTTGQNVTISGITVGGNTLPGYNGTFAVTVLDGTHFTYNSAKAGLVPPDNLGTPLTGIASVTWGVTTDPTTGRYDFNQPNVLQQFDNAHKARQQMAKAIYDTLVGITGGQKPDNNTVLPNTQQYKAARWLAQVAVNIVDYMDDDDFSTPFNWDLNVQLPPLTRNAQYSTAIIQDGCWVYGTELPKLVLSEAFVTVDNDSTDAGLATNAPTFYKQNIWVELLNPVQKLANTYNDTGTVNLMQVGQTSAAAIYRIDFVQNDTANLLAVANTRGLPTTTNRLSMSAANNNDCYVDDWNANGTDPTTIAPLNGGLYNDNNVINNTYTGFLLVKPSFSNFPGGRTPIINSPGSKVPPPLPAYPDPVHTTPRATAYIAKSAPTAIPKPTIVLRRLACPYLPSTQDQINTSGESSAPANVVYNNPYVTADYLDLSTLPTPVEDNRIADDNSPAMMPTPKQINTMHSYGKRQPYSAASPLKQLAPVTVPPWVQPANTPITTFFRHNSQANPVPLPFGPGLNQAVTTNDATLSNPFEWLVHLDRPLINVSELLHVSCVRPHELTQRFIQYGPPLQKHAHTVPWTNGTSLLHRALEFLEVPSRQAGTVPGGIEQGRLNLNTIDQQAFLALADPQSSYSIAQVNAVYDSLVSARGYGKQSNGTVLPLSLPPPTPLAVTTAFDQKVNPFQPFSAGFVSAGDTQYPYGNGINNTLIRSGPAGLTLGLGQAHPYQNLELLRKICNNATTTSNVFAVWVTVGFFQVVDDTVNPPKLGQEIGRSENKQLRHRMFAIVDRSALTIASGAIQGITINPPNPSSNSGIQQGQDRTFTIGPDSGFMPNGRAWAIQPGTLLELTYGGTNPPTREVIKIKTVSPPLPPVTLQNTYTADFANSYPNQAIQFTLRGNPGPYDMSMRMYTTAAIKANPAPQWVNVVGPVSMGVINKTIQVGPGIVPGVTETVTVTNVQPSPPMIQAVFNNNHPANTVVTWTNSVPYNPQTDPLVVPYFTIID